MLKNQEFVSEEFKNPMRALRAKRNNQPKYQT